MAQKQLPIQTTKRNSFISQPIHHSYAFTSPCHPKTECFLHSHKGIPIWAQLTSEIEFWFSESTCSDTEGFPFITSERKQMIPNPPNTTDANWFPSLLRCSIYSLISLLRNFRFLLLTSFISRSNCLPNPVFWNLYFFCWHVAPHFYFHPRSISIYFHYLSSTTYSVLVRKES